MAALTPAPDIASKSHFYFTCNLNLLFGYAWRLRDESSLQCHRVPEFTSNVCNL